MGNKFKTVEDLVHHATLAKEKAYCPYSKFRVGAALVTESNDVYTGCNVENASYAVSMCAERTAVGKAVSEGHKKFKAIAVITDKKKKINPCGMCRQILQEFGANMIVYVADVSESYDTRRLGEILPGSFEKEDLNAD